MFRYTHARGIATLVPILLLTTACATTSTRQIQVDPAVVEAEEARQRQLALEVQTDYSDRANELAHPILTSSVPLCEGDVGPLMGFRFANRYVWEDEWRRAAEAGLGVGDTVKVMSVTEGSAADRAGMRPGDRLLEIDGWSVPAGEGALESLSERLEAAAAPLDAVVKVVVRDEDGPRVLEVEPDRACDYPVNVVRSSGLNAFADGDRIYVTTTMMRFAEDDELQVVLAHELAHNAMGHIDAKKSNAILGGILGAAVDLLAASQGVNTGGSATQAGLQQGAVSHSQDFEREADYVGLYALALAGLPLEDAPRFWRHMAQENPEAIGLAYTHPTTAERFVRMERAVEEIREKQETGDRLRPEMEGGEGGDSSGS